MRIEDGTLYGVERWDIEDGTFIIPDNVTSIGAFAFSDCSELTNIIIPDGVTSIGAHAFRYCHSLTSITIPDSVKSIDRWAFEYCHSLTSVKIGNGITRIGYGAFWDCNGLITKKSVYKAFRITESGKLKCLDKIYTPDKWHTTRGYLELCENGIHYCTNLFEIFNYYYGVLDKDIVIYECETKGEDLREYNSSKHCCRWLKPVKRLTREEIMNALNKKD